jgi:hypothetical protein
LQKFLVSFEGRICLHIHFSGMPGWRRLASHWLPGCLHECGKPGSVANHAIELAGDRLQPAFFTDRSTQ